LKKKIELRKLIKIVGESCEVNLAEIEALIGQINKLKSEQYKTKMMLKTKLRLLLSEDQRSILYAHFKEKEREQIRKMKERMGGRMGGRGGMGGGGMPPF